MTVDLTFVCSLILLVPAAVTPFDFGGTGLRCRCNDLYQYHQEQGRTMGTPCVGFPGSESRSCGFNVTRMYMDIEKCEKDGANHVVCKRNYTPTCLSYKLGFTDDTGRYVSHLEQGCGFRSNYEMDKCHAVSQNGRNGNIHHMQFKLCDKNMCNRPLDDKQWRCELGQE